MLQKKTNYGMSQFTVHASVKDMPTLVTCIKNSKLNDTMIEIVRNKINHKIN